MSGPKQLLQFEMSLSQLAISLGDQVNFLSGSYSNRHEVYLNIRCCDNFSDLCIKSSSFTLQDFRKMAMLVLSDSSQKNGRVSRSNGRVVSLGAYRLPTDTSKGWEKLGILVRKFQLDAGGH